MTIRSPRRAARTEPSTISIARPSISLFWISICIRSVALSLLAEIKQRSPSTQVIMVTAYPTDDTRDECVKLGAAGYLTKPIDIAELKNVLRHLAGA